MTSWRPSPVLTALLCWSALTFIVFWLAAVRGLMDGPTYTWGSFGLSGSGTGGAYWFPVAMSAFALAYLWLGWRGARFPFHVLLLGWLGFLAGGALWLGFTSPELLHFHGDTFGVDWSLAAVVPGFFGAVFLVALVWAVRDLRHGQSRVVPLWSRGNTRWLIVVLALLPVQFVLLRFGDPHGTTDQVGVLLTLAQWALVSVAMYPRSDSRSASRTRSVLSRWRPRRAALASRA